MSWLAITRAILLAVFDAAWAEARARLPLMLAGWLERSDPEGAHLPGGQAKAMELRQPGGRPHLPAGRGRAGRGQAPGTGSERHLAPARPRQLVPLASLCKEPLSAPWPTSMPRNPSTGPGWDALLSQRFRLPAYVFAPRRATA